MLPSLLCFSEYPQKTCSDNLFVRCVDAGAKIRSPPDCGSRRIKAFDLGDDLCQSLAIAKKNEEISDEHSLHRHRQRRSYRGSGSFNGSFANTAHELGAAVIKGVLERAGVAAAEVDEVILGQVLSAGEGQNPARQAAMKAGIPQEATAWGNQLCGSGLRAVALGMQQIATGDAKIIVAGGWNRCRWLRTARICAAA